MNEKRQITTQELEAQFKHLRAEFQKDPYPSLQNRKNRLIKLKQNLLKYENELYQALNADYGERSHFDSMISDFMPSILSLNYTLKHLKKWMKDDKRHAGLLLAPSKVRVMYQPLGVVGIIVPWNFPLYLSFAPLITALGAGNKAMLKLSEFTPKTNQVMINILKDFKNDVIIIEGEVEISSAFSKLPFDHILFTGSTPVGKIVAKAAAENLTPVTLELGGKSPVIIDESANLKNAVTNILAGKSLNAGQICVAPDYILIPKTMMNSFKEEYKAQFNEFYGGNSKFGYGNIINQKQFERLQSTLKDAKEKGVEVFEVYESNEIHSQKIYPKILTGIKKEMTVESEEIFGPLLPLIEYNTLQDAIEYINQRPRPLALYIMSQNKFAVQKINQETHSGGVCVNDTLMHVAADDAPFGGIGDSGMGHYHGKEGFLTFSKAKTIVTSPAWFPKYRIILKNRELFYKLLRKLFVR